MVQLLKVKLLQNSWYYYSRYNYYRTLGTTTQGITINKTLSTTTQGITINRTLGTTFQGITINKTLGTTTQGIPIITELLVSHSFISQIFNQSFYFYFGFNLFNVRVNFAEKEKQT